MGQVIRLSDIYCAKQRERTTAQLRAEVLDETITMQTLVYFVEEMGLRLDNVMFRAEREFS